MHLIDTHAHLDSRKFDADRDDVIRRAVKAGVEQIITVGADLSSSRAAVALAERYPGIYATVGVHPHEAKTVTQAVLDELRELALHPRVVAIGEIGLDFYYDFAPRDAQRAAFGAQLDLAAEAGKPVVIHIRDKEDEFGAYDEVLAILRASFGNPSAATQQPGSPIPQRDLGVLHCFSGTPDIARIALDLGFYIGIDGPVTFPKAQALQSTVARLPLDRLLLETDCPYLAPRPRRGRRNEPAYLPYIAQKVAELQSVDVGDVARVTTANAKRLFCRPG